MIYNRKTKNLTHFLKKEKDLSNLQSDKSLCKINENKILTFC